MTEEMHRIVLRHAEQRGAESERDAVDAAENRADRGERRDTRTGDRQDAEHRGRDASIRDEHQHDHADRVERADPRRFRLRLVLHQHGERAGAAGRQRDLRVGARFLEVLANGARPLAPAHSGSNAAALVATTRMARLPSLSNHTS